MLLTRVDSTMEIKCYQLGLEKKKTYPGLDWNNLRVSNDKMFIFSLSIPLTYTYAYALYSANVQTVNHV